MKFLFLLPPSEWKNVESNFNKDERSYDFKFPIDILNLATEKDLKCTWKRFEEAVEINKTFQCNWFEQAINRYSGIMYNAIWYQNMTKDALNYFNDNFLIFSGLYWIVKPLDKIGNYKLPIETKWLAKYWKEDITNALNNEEVDYIVNFLPLSYMKMIDFKSLNKKVINVNFLHEKNWKIQKISHGVKKIKWEFINNICEQNVQKIADFWWKIEENDNQIDINIMH